VCRWLYSNLTYISSGIFLEVELLDHMEDLFLVFLGASILFFILVVLIYILNKVAYGFLFPPHPCQHLLLFVFLNTQWGTHRLTCSMYSDDICEMCYFIFILSPNKFFLFVLTPPSLTASNGLLIKSMNC
jgi:hypothetical protein